MKKIVTLLFAGLFTVATIGCGGATSKKEEPKPKPPADAKPMDAKPPM